MSSVFFVRVGVSIGGGGSKKETNVSGRIFLDKRQSSPSRAGGGKVGWTVLQRRKDSEWMVELNW